MQWDGKGIVINPGQSFLERFQAEGLHLQMIDAVIVTEDTPETHADIKNIYNLNYQLNKISSELHVIHYYLNHKAHQRLAHTLKPNFKQERNTIHSLELFLDSPDIEKEEISDAITLNYFSTGSRSSFAESERSHTLAIWLDLTWEMEKTRIGFVTGASWTPTLSSLFRPIDILVSGFGTTNPNDYGKLNYNENCMGYFGTYTLLEEVKPKLHLVSAFDGQNGDIRLEVIRKLRKEFANGHPAETNPPSILPTDRGMMIDLKTTEVKSSVNDDLLDPSLVQVCKTEEMFGRLQYFSRDSIL